MSKEEFIKQRCEIDKITEEEFGKRYRVVKCNCGQSYCKGYRCLDLDGLLKENQELNKHLEAPEPCNLKTLEDYKSYYEDTTKEQILADTYIDYCAYVNLAHRYAELKKQLEEKENIACNWKDSCLENAGKIEKLENQQKEFIEWLESEKDRLARECSQIYEDSLGKTRYVNEDIFNEVDTILSKYKEIIGDDK